MFSNNLKNALPKIEFKTKFYGIETEIATDHNGQINLTARFFISRKDILKRWSRIEGELPDTGIIQVSAQRVRHLESFSREEVVEYLNSRLNPSANILSRKSVGGSRRKVITCNAYERNLERRKYELYDIPSEDLVKFENRTGFYTVKETLGITVNIPLMFHMNLLEEVDRIVDLRKLIIALNTKYKTQDRLDQLTGAAPYPEYEASQLHDLRSKGYWGKTPYELRNDIKNNFEVALW
jgi:hypothetical protein